MNFEKPTEPLNVDEAHEEANMMKVLARANHDQHENILASEKPADWNMETKNLTAEDYDKALEVVEEMKKMVEEEPLTEKVIFKLARLSAKSVYGFQKLLTHLSTLPDSFIATGGIIREENETLKKLNDASSELQKLKAEAEKWGRTEIKGYEKNKETIG